MRETRRHKGLRQTSKAPVRFHGGLARVPGRSIDGLGDPAAEIFDPSNRIWPPTPNDSRKLDPEIDRSKTRQCIRAP